MCGLILLKVSLRRDSVELARLTYFLWFSELLYLFSVISTFLSVMWNLTIPMYNFVLSGRLRQVPLSRFVERLFYIASSLLETGFQMLSALV